MHSRSGKTTGAVPFRRLWIFSFADKSVVEIPKPEGGCNDICPMWIGETIYFLSDRNGDFNLFSYHYFEQGDSTADPI